MRATLLRAGPFVLSGLLRLWDIVCPFSRGLKALELRVQALESSRA